MRSGAWGLIRAEIDRGCGGFPGGCGRRGCPGGSERGGVGCPDHGAVGGRQDPYDAGCGCPSASRSGPCGYDKDGDNHYDTISAFIKSMRGSDPDAAVYYLAKMLYAGEDVKFIARRIMICASEDVGNADPMALTVAVSRRPGGGAYRHAGGPDHPGPGGGLCGNGAQEQRGGERHFQSHGCGEAYTGLRCRLILQDAHYPGAEKLGQGIGYKYAHDYPNHYVKQQYMPSELEGRVFYRPSDNGYEKTIATHMKKLKEEAE